MTAILGLVGSLRKRSFNRALLQAAREVAPEHVSLELATLEGIPVYDGDVEAEEGIPAAVSSLKDRVAGADGLLIASPEYNNSIPGVLKNAIDWLSRPPADIGRVFRDRPVGLIGATPGRGGTRFAQVAWLPVFRTLGMRPWFGGTLYLAGVASAFDEDRRLVDPKVRELLTEYVRGFAEFVRAERP